MLVGSWLGLVILGVKATTENMKNDKIDQQNTVPNLRTQYKWKCKRIVTSIMMQKKKQKPKQVVETILAYLLPGPIFEGDVSSIQTLTLSPDGRLLFAGGDNLTIWDFTRGYCLLTAPTHFKIISCAFSAKNNILVTSDYACMLCVWHVQVTGDPIVGETDYSVTVTHLRSLKHCEKKHQSSLISMCCFLDDHRILSGGGQEISVWEWKTGTKVCVRQFGDFWFNTPFRMIAVINNDSWIATKGSSIISVNPLTIETKETGMHISTSCVTADGEYLLVGGINGLLDVYGLPEIDRVCSIDCDIWITACIDKIESGTENLHVLVIGGQGLTNKIQVWEWQPGTLKMKRRYTIDDVHKIDIATLCFAAEGEMIISSGRDELKLWDINTGTLYKEKV